MNPYRLYLIVLSTFFILESAIGNGQNNKTQKDSGSEAKVILFLGDSLTEGYGIAPEKAYPQIVQEMFKKNGIHVRAINAGISGSTTKSGLARLKWHLREKPQILFLALGANDGLRGFDPIETKKNLKEIVQEAKKNNVQVILAGMKMPPNYGKEYTAKFEKTFSDLAKEEKTEFMPFILKDVAGVRELNLPDGIHPNELGHQKMAKNVYEFLYQKIGKK